MPLRSQDTTYNWLMVSMGTGPLAPPLGGHTAFRPLPVCWPAPFSPPCSPASGMYQPARAPRQPLQTLRPRGLHTSSSLSHFHNRKLQEKSQAIQDLRQHGARSLLLPPDHPRLGQVACSNGTWPSTAGQTVGREAIIEPPQTLSDSESLDSISKKKIRM